MDTELIFSVFLVSLCTQWISAVNVDEEHHEDTKFVTPQSTAVATTMQSFRSSRDYRRGHDVDDEHDEHHEENDEMVDSKVMAKSEYWGGYYDFLINEGSYKFWAVFQLATAALLIYSGFAALYYAKVNPATTDDYEDYFLRRRRRRRRDTGNASFFGIDSVTFQRVMEALERRNYQST